MPDVQPLVDAYYAKPGNAAGGSLHIVLDDYNIGDDSIQYCIDRARERGDLDGVLLGETLQSMSKTQRLKLARGRSLAL